MWPTVKYDGISVQYGLDPVNAAAILDIKSNADRSDSATHNGRELKKGLFSKAINWLKRGPKENSTAKVVLRVENIALNPLRNTAKNRENVAAKLVFETSVTVINERLDNIEAGIRDLARPVAIPKPALMATVINDFSGALDFMKNPAEIFMGLAIVRSPIPEPMENNGASADARNLSGQGHADAVVKFDKSAMRSMFNSIRAYMRNVVIVEEKAKPEDKEFYVSLAAGLLPRLDKIQVSMKAIFEAEGASWDEWLVTDKSQFDLDAGAVAGGARAVVSSQYRPLEGFAGHSSVEPFYEEILRPLLDENGVPIPYKSHRTDIA